MTTEPSTTTIFEHELGNSSSLLHHHGDQDSASLPDTKPRQHSRTPVPPLTGQCQCGATWYTCPTAPLRLYVCHCLESLRQSSSAFALSLAKPHGSTKHTVASEDCVGRTERTADSGCRHGGFCCRQCGVRLWHYYVDPELQGHDTMRAGTLDRKIDLRAVVHFFTRTMLPGVVVPEGLKSFWGASVGD